MCVCVKDSCQLCVPWGVVSWCWRPRVRDVPISTTRRELSRGSWHSCYPGGRSCRSWSILENVLRKWYWPKKTFEGDKHGSINIAKIVDTLKWNQLTSFIASQNIPQILLLAKLSALRFVRGKCYDFAGDRTVTHASVLLGRGAEPFFSLRLEFC